MSAIKARLSRFKTVEEYVHGYGHYYFRGGILLPTRQARDEGTHVSFHLQIASGETVLRGEGVVQQVRTNADGNTVGMVIRFNKLDARSKELVERILAEKREARTSANLAVASDSSPPESGRRGLSDLATGEHLGAAEIGEIADAIESTFDSIFTGSFATVEPPHTPGPGADAEETEPAPAPPPDARDSDAHAEDPAYGDENDELDRIAAEAVERALAAGDDEGVMTEDDEPEPETDPLSFADLHDTTGSPKTVLGIPGIGSSATVDAVQEALGHTPSHQAAHGANEPSDPEQSHHVTANRERVRDFIKDVTGRHDSTDAPSTTTDDPAFPDALGSASNDNLFNAADTDDLSGTREPTDDIMRAAEHSKVEALEAEAALDQLLQSGAPEMVQPAILDDTSEMLAPLPAPRPHGIFGRFFAWLAGLFGRR